MLPLNNILSVFAVNGLNRIGPNGYMYHYKYAISSRRTLSLCSSPNPMLTAMIPMGDVAVFYMQYLYASLYSFDDQRGNEEVSNGFNSAQDRSYIDAVGLQLPLNHLDGLSLATCLICPRNMSGRRILSGPRNTVCRFCPKYHFGSSSFLSFR